MPSLEKMMFFLPNRLFVNGPDMYVSFNLAVIPTDMRIQQTTLYVPMPPSAQSGVVSIYEITGGWDESLLEEGYRPSITSCIRRIRGNTDEDELQVSIGAMAENWRINHRHNHGLYVHLEAESSASFVRERPPYVTLCTE